MRLIEIRLLTRAFSLRSVVFSLNGNEVSTGVVEDVQKMSFLGDNRTKTPKILINVQI